jgi:hypothetical protein
MAPEYISELCELYSISQRQTTLRSAPNATTLLKTINSNAKPNYYHRAFSVSSSELWNKLPVKIREAETLNQFKSALKTHLFRKSFPDVLIS